MDVLFMIMCVLFIAAPVFIFGLCLAHLISKWNFECKKLKKLAAQLNSDNSSNEVENDAFDENAENEDN